MRRTIAIVLMLFLTNAPAVDLRYTATERDTCEAQGGCITVTRRAIVEMVRDAHQSALMRCGQEL